MTPPNRYYVGDRVLFRDEISDPRTGAELQDDSEVVTFLNRSTGEQQQVTPQYLADPVSGVHGYEAQFTLPSAGQWIIYGRATGVGSGNGVRVIEVSPLP